MTKSKTLNFAISLIVVVSLLFQGTGASLGFKLEVANAAPVIATDETQVPHYFGPAPNWANSPFTLPDATVEITGNGMGAAAQATVGANGTITGINITNPGSGYTFANVTITGAGSGAGATATVMTSGAVTGVTLGVGGADYTAPVVTFSGGGAAGTVVAVGNALQTRADSTDNATTVFIVLPTDLPTGVLQNVQTWNQAQSGSGSQPSAGLSFHAYVLRPTGTPDEYTVAFDSGALTVPALVNPAGEAVTYPLPDVPVQAGDKLAFYGQGVPFDFTGGDIIGYPVPAAPAANDTLTLGGNIPLFAQARTYSFAADILDTSAIPPVTQATATAFGGVAAITLDNAGSGYTFPTVDIDFPDDPNGMQATAHAEWDQATGAITGIVVDNPGSGYSTAPGVVVRDGTAFDPINNGGAGAMATATLTIQTIVVDTYGAGYVSAPAVTITDASGIGSGATAAATTDVGAVTAITLINGGSGYITGGGIKKFTDSLPGLCLPPACPTTGKYIPLGVPESKIYNGVNADEYVIGLVQYRTSFSSSLPPTLVRGYVQLETAANASISQHYPLTNEMLDGTQVAVTLNGQQVYAVTPPQYLGPTLAATKNKPVRIVFHNFLPTGVGGELFLPVDSTMMGSGMGPMEMAAPVNNSSVLDEIRNPTCTSDPQAVDAAGMSECFKQNRATLHLHGGISPWISDGTPHQWITPAGEDTTWPEGVAVENVPDMDVCNAADDGCQTFYYTNQQSARLLFYHDHSWGITRLNVYAGEAAGYLITDSTEQALVNSSTIPADQIPLVIQDKTFVPGAAQLAAQDPTWDAAKWGGYGNFWYHHVYMPAQNPGDPSGMSAYGRWMYGPWFWPPAGNTVFGPIANPYYNMDPIGPDGIRDTADDWSTPLAVPCNLDDPATWQYDTDPFCEPAQIPGTPNISAGMEQFNDTPIVNGVAYPTLTLEPKAYRLRILSAANDRFFNFQWYVGDNSTASTSLNANGEVIGATEVALNPAELEAAQTDPNVFPTPVLGTAGPDWIQIGTEGGFLPAPAVIDGQQPTTWITDPTRFDVGNVDKHSLLLAPAERADVIVDFSKYAGKTLILYNDAPAAFPARVSTYDYYTGAPDLSPNGAPTILPGYGPNTRTIMQVKIAAAAPAPAYNLIKLQNAFKHNAAGTGVFESGQHPIIVGQAAYNSAYGTNFAASSNCNVAGGTLTRCDGLLRVNDTMSFSFNTLKAPNAKMTLPVQPKAIHDEMNATTFDEFGRMQANLGVEAQPPTPGAQNVTLYPYTASPTELIDGTNLPKAMVTYDANGNPVSDVKITPISTASDGTQIWRVTHNGVDTHPIHFHLFDVQLLNRVTWDNIIIPTEANELGWKDTVRMAPLEDTIVALRPIIPQVPFDLPNSVHLISPMMPADVELSPGLLADPQGNPVQVFNRLINFGWEYVYHCHILSHEEMDMMRPVLLALPPVAPGVTFDPATNTLTWIDNSLSETAFAVEKSADGVTWTEVWRELRLLSDPASSGEVFTWVDPGLQVGDRYRVVAENTVGDTNVPGFPVVTTESAGYATTLAAAPANLTAVAQPAQAPTQVNLAWTSTAANETGFVIERAVNGGAFANLMTLAANVASFVDTTIARGNTYTYQVKATNSAGASAPSNQATVVIPFSGTATPTNLTAVQVAGSTRVRLTWTDASNNENLFQVWRSANGGAFSQLGTVNRTAAQRTATGGAVVYTTPNQTAGSSYAYYVVAVNTVPNPDDASAPSNTASVAIPALPAAPSNLRLTARTNASISLAWNDNSTNEVDFEIQRRTGGAAFATLAIVPANTTVYLNAGLGANWTFFYRVRARNATGTSGWSNTLTAVTLP
ncbi:MAG: multicopper oxidase domain-containing protein [Anaerolineales bacterium]|nr:multicopper oxidase domain-containing protein [Anaerolineales bacterium]